MRKQLTLRENFGIIIYKERRLQKMQNTYTACVFSNRMYENPQEMKEYSLFKKWQYINKLA